MKTDAFWQATRGHFDGIVNVAVDWLAAKGVRPNSLTWFSLLPAIASIVAAARGDFVLAAAMMALGGICDFLDGPLARRANQTTTFGALLDSTLDRFADAAPLLGLVYFYAHYPWAAFIAATAAFSGYTVSYVRARAEGLSIALPWMWMRRTERLLITGAGFLLAWIPAPFLTVPAPMTLLFVLSVGILALTAAFHALFVAEGLIDPPTPNKTGQGER